MKNIFKYAVSVLAGAMAFAACQQEEAPLGSEISVAPTSLVVAGQNAENQTVTVTANGDWIAVVPEWIKLDPAYGSGNTTVVMSFADNLDADNTLAAKRTATVLFSVNDASAELEVEQEGDPNKAPAEVKVVTCAEFNAQPDNAGPFRLTGTIVNVETVSASYKNANLTIADETGKVYLYRLGPGTDENGEDLKIENYGFAEGDQLTVEGYKSSYNESPQMGQGGFVVSHVRSLLAVSPVEFSFEKAAGSFAVNVSVADDPEVFFSHAVSVDWIKYEGLSKDGKKMFANFSYTEFNEMAAPREGEITFTATKGDRSSAQTVKVVQYGITPDPVSVEQAITNEKGTWLSVKGIVTGMNKKGYIITDSEGNAMHAYVNAVPTVSLGDEVLLTGKLDSYNNFWQIGTPVTRVLSSKNEFDYPDPVVIDAAEDIDAYASGTHLPVYVEAVGVPTGSYGDMEIVSGYKVSPYQTSSSINVGDYVGKTVKYRGYGYQNYNGKTLNLILLSIEEMPQQ